MGASDFGFYMNLSAVECAQKYFRTSVLCALCFFGKLPQESGALTHPSENFKSVGEADKA